MNPYIQLIQDLAEHNKYTRWYLWLVSEPSDSHTIQEKHHILPRCFHMGGEKDITNIVSLTQREHFIAHKLLTKMFKGELQRKMRYAFWAMCGLYSKGRRTTSRYYDSAKTELRKARTGHLASQETREKMSRMRKGTRTGSENSMFGRTGNQHPNYGKPGPMTGRTHSDKSKEKMSTNNIMKRDRYAGARIRWSGSKRTEHAVAMVGSGNHHAQHWSIYELSTGKTTSTNDLKQFCRDHSWNYQSMMTMRSNGKPYKGFTIDIL